MNNSTQGVPPFGWYRGLKSGVERIDYTPILQTKGYAEWLAMLLEDCAVAM
jgi:hypothetical protein